jgi:hypothetical protein
VVAVTCVAVSASGAWALTAASGRYAGTVGTFSITFKVENGRISHLVSNFEATTCSGLAPAEPSPYFSFPALAIKSGYFTGSTTIHDASGLSPQFTIRGSFTTPTRATGTLHEHISVPAGFGAPSCTESSKFSAKRVR